MCADVVMTEMLGRIVLKDGTCAGMGSMEEPRALLTPQERSELGASQICCVRWKE
jgi:hypothetical protein